MRLPSLLASLPKDGKFALVRPQVWPENSFYRVTKTSLKFREVPGAEPDQTVLRAKGKAWGQLFWKGKQVHPRDKHSPQIKNALKHKWEVVAPSTIPESLTTSFVEADQAQNQAQAKALDELKTRREGKRVRVAEAAAAKRQAEAEKLERVAKHEAWMNELFEAAKAKRKAKAEQQEAANAPPPSSQ